MRLFAALEVPEAVRRRLDAAVAPVRRRQDALGWSRAESWHLTVAFLGEVGEERLPEVVEALAGAAARAPEAIGLEFGPAGRFGRRVLWVGVRDQPAGAVAALGAAAQAALAAAGLPVDAKEVRPHLTLARSRNRDRAAQIDGRLVGEVPHTPGEWTVRELVLFASVPAGRGQPNHYQPLARVPLGGDRKSVV